VTEAQDATAEQYRIHLARQEDQIISNLQFTLAYHQYWQDQVQAGAQALQQMQQYRDDFLEFRRTQNRAGARSKKGRARRYVKVYIPSQMCFLERTAQPKTSPSANKLPTVPRYEAKVARFQAHIEEDLQHLSILRDFDQFLNSAEEKLGILYELDAEIESRGEIEDE
ncbi:hypothetical protein LTS18_013316, partial [Coniosporium uncinatum]